ncbi:MAG: alcohol dehydrogenase catalytic domain-containing protein [Bryobacteraceae bacterium]
MISVELVAQRTLDVVERPVPPDPGPGEVLVRLRAVGLCGSDLHWYQDGRVGYNEAVYPMVLGHEPVGEVVAAGPGVDTHRPGDKVAIEPSVVCGVCEFCRMGRPNNCVSCVFMGGTQLPGFFREFATVPARNAEHFPSDFDYLTATLIEPVAVIVHVLELAPVSPGDVIAVLGAGPIGLLCANLARLAGAAKVIVADRVRHRLRIATQVSREFHCVDMRETSVTDAVADLTKGRGADIVFDAAGAPETMAAGMHIARPSGQYVLIGIPSARSTPFDLHTAMNKELRIQTVKRSNHKGHEAIELIREGKIPDVIITHRLPLTHTAEAFELVSEYRDGVGKLVVEMPAPAATGDAAA